MPKSKEEKMHQHDKSVVQQEDTDNPRWLLIALGSIGAHQVQSFIEEPEERLFRLVVMGAMVLVWLSRLFIPSRMRGILWMVLSLPPMFGAFAGHLIPISRTSKVPHASETLTLHFGGCALLFALGAALARKG
jgi:hypothetical protein